MNGPSTQWRIHWVRRIFGATVNKPHFRTGSSSLSSMSGTPLLSPPSTPARSYSPSTLLPQQALRVHHTSSAPADLIFSTRKSTPPSLDTADNDGVIYRYKRTFHGIIGQHSVNEPSTVVTSALGRAADEYLHAHGYLSGTICLIQKYFEETLTKDDFVNTIAQNGIPVAEAEYLHSLIIRKRS